MFKNIKIYLIYFPWPLTIMNYSNLNCLFSKHYGKIYNLYIASFKVIFNLFIILTFSLIPPYSYTPYSWIFIHSNYINLIYLKNEIWIDLQKYLCLPWDLKFVFYNYPPLNVCLKFWYLFIFNNKNNTLIFKIHS